MKRVALLMPLLAALCSCSSEQVYNTAQGWQRNQCAKLPDKADFDRCMNSSSVSYEAYKRETETKRE